MPEKIDQIRKQNAEWAKETPFNHCDRWCERCPIEIKQGCRLYLDEVGREAFNIAHGRALDDTRILEEDLEGIAQDLEKAITQHEENSLEELDLTPEVEQEIIKEMEIIEQKTHRHHLTKAVHQYFKRAREFLRAVGFFEKKFPADIQYHLHTIAWYHTLFSAKMQRALTDLYEVDSMRFEDFALHDCVAQLDICRKGVDQSMLAFKVIAAFLPSDSGPRAFLAMLDNIKEQIALIEMDIEDIEEKL